MGALESKIFDVLVGNITIEVFENWLYQSKYLEENLNADSFIFEVVNINYKSDDAFEKLEKFTINSLSEAQVIFLYIKKLCAQIINGITINDLNECVGRIMKFFEYEDSLPILWDFYHFQSDIELYYNGFHSKDELLHFAHKFADLITYAISRYTNNDEALSVLDKQFYYDKRKISNSKFSNKNAWFSKLKRLFCIR